MNSIIIFALIISAVTAISVTEQWLNFKQNHSKSYKNVVEEKLRFTIFQINLNKIKEHNAKYERGETSYYLGTNHFADMSSEEFSNMLLRQMSSKPKIKGSYADFSSVEVPDSVSWKDKGPVLGVKDQGSCGSCWSFSATGGLEGQNFLINNISIPLSEQELMDCSVLYDNNGCSGGYMRYALEYVVDQGITSEESYPYEAHQYSCRRDVNKIVVKAKEFKILSQNEEDLKKAVATVGPISVSIFVTPDLQLYEGGIFDDASCPNDQINHGVLAIGYGNEGGKDFWEVKNSWGAQWGEAGFFRIKRNPSICAMTTDSCYPVLESN